MPASDIVIKGAREHNLRERRRRPAAQQADLPDRRQRRRAKARWRSTRCMPRGSGGTSRVCPAFARQFLGQMPKPDVDHISGLSPSISISQKSSGNNPRSTVGTITEIYDFLRVLYARVGHGHCPQCGRPITAQTREQIIGRILSAAGRDAVRRARPAHPRPEGRVPRPVRGPAEAGLRAGPRRRRRRAAHRRPVARPPDAAQHRGRRRSARRCRADVRGRGWPKRSSWRCGWGRGI